MNMDERTQELIALRLGMLMLGSARLQAENEALRAAAAAQAGGGAAGVPSGTEQRTGQDVT